MWPTPDLTANKAFLLFCGLHQHRRTTTPEIDRSSRPAGAAVPNKEWDFRWQSEKAHADSRAGTRSCLVVADQIRQTTGSDCVP